MSTGHTASTLEDSRVKETSSTLVDSKVNVKVKLALLWTALMFFYIYNDILSFFQPGHVADLVDGQLEGVQFTQSFLIGAALLMALPSLMIILSLTMRAGLNRWANIVAGVFQLLVLAGTQFVGESDVWAYWRLYELLEAVFIVLIIWSAWTWPAMDSQNP